MKPRAKADAAPRNGSGRAASPISDAYVTFLLGEQMCGVPVLAVRDVLANQTITRIPLAPPEVAGNLNLRGRIVTAIDLRRKLQLPPRPAGLPPMSLVTDMRGDLYALLVDQVSEVVTLDPAAMEPNPPTLPPAWADYSQGINRSGSRLLVILAVDRLLRCGLELAA